jgi:hypothetical protein
VFLSAIGLFSAFPGMKFDTVLPKAAGQDTNGQATNVQTTAA